LKRYFLYLQFKGTHYHGWQIQQNAVGVQDIVQQKLQVLFQEEASLTGAGRTDQGVHARQMVAHFDQAEIPDPPTFLFQLNSLLPKDIVATALREVKPDFHARYDARQRTYKYFCHRHKEVFRNELSARIYKDVDMKLMNRAAEYLVGEQDFSAFSKSRTQVKTNICDLQHAVWVKEEDQWVFTIRADRFLRNMVRAVVGTLFQIGEGLYLPEQMQEVIASRDRKKAGPSAPAEGLYLWEIEYPPHGFI
jgi:tRNA pseudouridine38-40 synthase